MNIKDIIGDIDNLTTEQKQAALDAIQAIQRARMGGGGGGGGAAGLPLESNVEIDPDLLMPPTMNNGSGIKPKFDDPEGVLKKQKQMQGNMPAGNSENNATPDSADLDSVPKNSGAEADGAGATDSTSATQETKVDPDYDFDPSKLDSDQTPPSTDSAGSDHNAPDDTTSRKNNIQRTLNLAQQALKKAKQSGASTKELEDAMDKLKNLSDDDIKNLSGDELGDLINEVLDAIDRVIPVQYSTDIEARVQKIKAETSAAAKEIKQEDQLNKRSEEVKKELEKQKIKAREEERERFASASLKPISRFYLDFSRAIEEQVEDLRDEVEEDSWATISRRHDGSDGIIAPGTVNRETWGKDIPVIDIYMDCSDSWSASDLQVGMRAVKSVQKFEDSKEIKINRFYFSNHVFSDYASAKAEGGTWAWPFILKNIKATKAKNIIILTDHDMNTHAELIDKHVTVDGHVWYIWKNGDSAPNLPYYLRGRNGTSQYGTW